MFLFPIPAKLYAIMHKLLQSVRKEFLLLSRDPGGLIILFLMPLVLIVTITSIQDGTFQILHSRGTVPVILVDNDHGNLSSEIIDNLNRESNFKIISQFEDQLITEEMAREAVFKGEYQLAIVIPENMSDHLKKKYSKT